jgi:glycosyltransferase involved in cell wall biosynthesis
MHVITGLDAGGAETQLGQLLLAARDAGRPQSVVSLTPGGQVRARLEAQGVTVRDLGMRRGRPSLRALIALARLIRRERPAVVQSWLYHADLIALFALLLSGCRARTRLVWGIRCSDLDLTRYGRGLRLVVRACALLSRLPDAVVVNAASGEAWHRRLGYRPRRFVLIENGIDTARFRPDPAQRATVRAALGLAPDEPVLMHVARVDPMKDHPTLFAALDRLPGVRALLVGAGTEGLPAHPAALALGRREDVAALLAAGDLVVLPSAFGEGFSNALAEGMACGLPAVASAVGDAARIVGETGLVVPPRAPEALADAVRQLLAEPAAARAARGRAARARIEREFSLARTLAAHEALHAELAGASASRCAASPA